MATNSQGSVKPIFKGLIYPFQKGPEGIPASTTDLDNVKVDLGLLLNTRKRERIMLPEFGVDLERLVFENNGALLRAKIFREIADAIGNFEPRVNLTNVEITDSKNTVFIDVQYEILGLQDSLKLQFTRD